MLTNMMAIGLVENVVMRSKRQAQRKRINPNRSLRL